MNNISSESASIPVAELVIPGKKDLVRQTAQQAQVVPGLEGLAPQPGSAIPVAELAIPGKAEQVAETAEVAASAGADSFLNEEDKRLKYDGASGFATDKSK